MSQPLHPERTAAFRRWFQLTRSEHMFVAGILLIFIIGLWARWRALRHEAPEEYPPAPGMELDR
ncbi:MAG: hypothetical protein KBA51_08605 [Kiritimatiellae bacterium]|nr:hypothetical protein [Kiritimatiellia bacterium]